MNLVRRFVEQRKTVFFKRISLEMREWRERYRTSFRVDEETFKLHGEGWVYHVVYATRSNVAATAGRLPSSGFWTPHPRSPTVQGVTGRLYNESISCRSHP